MPKQKPPDENGSTDCKKQAENNNMMEEDPHCEPPPGNEGQICEQDGGSPCEAFGATGHSKSKPPDVMTVMEEDMNLQKVNFQAPPLHRSPSSSADIKKENVAKEKATTLLGGPSKDDVSPKNLAQGECIDPKSNDQTLSSKSDPGLPAGARGQQAVVASVRTFERLNCPPDGLHPKSDILDGLPFGSNSGHVGKRHQDEISPHIADKPKTIKRSSPSENPSRESARCKGKSEVNQAPAEDRGHSDGGEQPSPQCLGSSQHTDPGHQAERTRQPHTLPHRNSGAECGARSPPTDRHAEPEEKARSSTKVADEQTHENKEPVASRQKHGDSVGSSVPSDVSQNEVPATKSGAVFSDVAGSPELTAESMNNDNTFETYQDETQESIFDELDLEGQFEIVSAGGRQTVQVPTATASRERSPETRPLQQSSTLQSDAQSEASASSSTHEQTTHEQTTNKQTTSQTENNAASEIASSQSPCTGDSPLSENRVSQTTAQPPSQPGAGPVQASACPPCSRRQPTPVRPHTPRSASPQSGMSQGTLLGPVLSPRCHPDAVPTRQSSGLQQRPVLVRRPVQQSSQPCETSGGLRGREAQGPGLRPRGSCVIRAGHHSDRQRQEDQQESQNTPSVCVVDLRQHAVDMGEHRDLNVDARDLHTDIDLQEQRGLPREITGASHLFFRPEWPYPEMAAGNAEWAGLPPGFQRILDEGLMGRIATVLALTPGGTASVLCVVCQMQEVNVHLFPCHHRPLCRLCLVRGRLCRCPLQDCYRLITFFFQFQR